MREKKRSILLHVIGVASAIIIPLCIIAWIACFIITQPALYSTILKRADLLSTFVKTRSLMQTEESRLRVERELHIEDTRAALDAAAKDYEAKLAAFNAVNKTTEYEQLRDELREVKNMSWEDMTSIFASKDEFKAYKKEQLAGIDADIDAIKTYRKSARAQINIAEDAYESALDIVEDLTDELASKEKKAEKIMGEDKKSIAGKIFADIETITPELTEVLNEKIIDGQIKPIAGRLLDFLSSKEEYKKNVYYEANSKGESKLKVRFPAIELNLVSDGKHLLSDTFVDIVKKHARELNDANFFIRLFKFSGGGFAGMISNSYLKDIGLKIKGDKLFLENNVVSGKNARLARKVMKAAQRETLLSVGAPCLALLCLLALILFPAPWNQKKPVMRRVLLYPSVICAAACIIGLVWCWVFGIRTSNIYASAYIKTAAETVSAAILLPLLVIFIALILLSGFFKTKKIKQSS